LPGDPRPQTFQQRRLPERQRVWYRLAEHLADYHRQFLSLILAVLAQVLRGEPDSGGGGLAQLTFLISAAH